MSVEILRTKRLLRPCKLPFLPLITSVCPPLNMASDISTTIPPLLLNMLPRYINSWTLSELSSFKHVSFLTSVLYSSFESTIPMLLPNPHYCIFQPMVIDLTVTRHHSFLTSLPHAIPPTFNKLFHLFSSYHSHRLCLCAKVGSPHPSRPLVQYLYSMLSDTLRESTCIAPSICSFTIFKAPTSPLKMCWLYAVHFMRDYVCLSAY